MFSRSVLRLLAALCLWAATVDVAKAQDNFYFITDHAGYTGSWSFYSSYADALTGANAKSAGTIDQRNLGIYITNGLYPPTGGPPNSSIITTNWYSSKDGTPGTGNTSNASKGFFQIYNDPTNSATKATGFWDPDKKTMTVSETFNKPATADTVSGPNGGIKGPTGLESRFSPTDGLGFKETQGEYLNYVFQATAGGLNGVPMGGAFEDNGSISNNVTGSFNAIFQNTGGNAALEGFYSINLNFNNTSTVVSDGLTFFVNPQDNFGAQKVLPEPASCVTFAMVLAASAGFGWRKSRQRKGDAAPAL